MNRITVNNISKTFKIGFKKNQSVLSRFVSVFSGKEPKKEIWALKDISFTAKAGEIIGIIGSNGSGKSTLLRIIADIYAASAGTIHTNGRIISLIGLRMGLKERLTATDNIFLCCSLFGLDQKTIVEHLDSIVAFAELENFKDTKLYQFSQGMTQRLAFSIATHCNPEILLLDEVFEVGDEDFRVKSSNHIQKLAGKGTTVLLVTHELPMITKYCQRVLWIDKGAIIAQGYPKEIINKYIRHVTVPSQH